MVEIVDPWGRLTHQQVYDCLPPGALPLGLCTWAHMRMAIQRLPVDLQVHIREVAAEKDKSSKEKKRQGDQKAQAKRRATQHVKRDAEHAAVIVQVEGTFRLAQTPGEYLSLPTDTENEDRVAAFIDHTSNNALSRSICIVCARELMQGEGSCSKSDL